MVWVSVVLIALGALACLVPAGVYMYLHRGWRHNTFALLLLPNLLAEGVLFVWLAIVRVLPQGEYRGWTSLGFYGVAVGVMVWRAVAYLKEEIKLYKELNAASNVRLSERKLDQGSKPKPSDGSRVRRYDRDPAMEAERLGLIPERREGTDR